MKGEIEVYTHSAVGRGRPRFIPKLGGKWVRVKAVIEGSKLQLVAASPKEKYEKTLALSESSACSASSQYGRSNCIVVTGFNRNATTKRVFDCLSIEARNNWQTAIIAASSSRRSGSSSTSTTSRAKSSKALGKKEAKGGATTLTSKAEKEGSSKGGAVTLEAEKMITRQEKKTLESFMRWHEQWRRTPVFKAASKARRRWWAAMYLVARDVKERYGYTSLELINLQKKLTGIGVETMSEIRRKARRIIRDFVQQHKSNVKAREAFQNIVASGAKAKGLALHEEAAAAPDSFSSSSGFSSGGGSGGGLAASSSLRFSARRRLDSPRAHHQGGFPPTSTSQQQRGSYLDSGFRKQLQVLLRKDHVLPKLTRTLEMIRRKERHQFVLSDAMRGLWVARCVRALLNLPGGLAAVLAMPQERGCLRRLLAAALLCRVPLLTTLVLEMLAALLLLPGREGTAVVLNVISQIDKIALWGKPLCSDYLLRPSPEALKWSLAANRNSGVGNHEVRKPPPLVPLATLLHDTPEHNCCPELRSAVVSLFAALCRSEPTRSAAQWTQARIFHACRAALTVHSPRDSSKQGGLTSRRTSSSPQNGESSDAKERARRRRSEIGLERATYNGSSEAGTTCDLDDDDDSSSLGAPELHPCPPLMKLLETLERRCEEEADANLYEVDDASNGCYQLFRIQLEHFLDGWDKNELDEADEIDALPVGSADRTELLCERIRRSVLLLGRHLAIDDALHAFALDLEHGAFLPFDRLAASLEEQQQLSQHLTNDDDGASLGGVDPSKRIALDMNATLEAVCRLHNRGRVVGRGVRALVHAQASGLSPAQRGASPRAGGENSGTTSAGRRPPGGFFAEEQPRLRLGVPPRPPQQQARGPALKDDPRFASYFRMIKLHVPKLAVANKLAQDGHDPAILDLDPNEPAPDNAPSDEGDAVDTDTVDSALPLESDPTFATYFRMLKMHVPRGAVESKMRDAGLDPSVLDLDPTEPAPRALPNDDDDEENRFGDGRGGGGDATENAEVVDVAPPPGCGRAPKHRLRKVFWDVVNDGKGTLWEDTAPSAPVGGGEDTRRDQSPAAMISEAALEELELVFGPAPRRGEVSKADKSAEAAAQKKSRYEQELSSVGGGGGGPRTGDDDQRGQARPANSKSLIAEALGEKRAFALNLLYGSIRTSNDECVAAVASLDPDDRVFVGKLPRLGTLWNLLSRKEDVVHIEHAAVRAGLLDDQTKCLKDKAQDAVLKQEYDGLSQLIVGLLDRARRPRAKVQALWLYATVGDRAAELSTAIANFDRVASAIRNSGGLKKILKFVLAVTNFANHGSDRGQNVGVRLSALAKLQTTRTTNAGNSGIRTLLQFVVRHADVSSSTLKHEIPSELLNAVRNGQSRGTISDAIDQLRHERDAAANERGVLSREATTQAPGVDARRVAVAAAAAARMAHIVADVEEEVSGLDASFLAMDTTVDGVLQYFGEPNPQAVDVADWLRQLEAFLTQYDGEYAEFREHNARREKRSLLAKKQRDREQILQTEADDPQGSTTPRSPRRGDSTEIDPSTGATTPPASPAKRTATNFDRLLVDAPRRVLAGDSASEFDVIHVCAQCRSCNHTVMPGAFAKDADHTWYCADCWWEFSLNNPDWRAELGEDTTPVVNTE